MNNAIPQESQGKMVKSNWPQCPALIIAVEARQKIRV
jgi:hypothetical protein